MIRPIPERNEDNPLSNLAEYLENPTKLAADIKADLIDGYKAYGILGYGYEMLAVSVMDEKLYSNAVEQLEHFKLELGKPAVEKLFELAGVLSMIRDMNVESNLGKYREVYLEKNLVVEHTKA